MADASAAVPGVGLTPTRDKLSVRGARPPLAASAGTFEGTETPPGSHAACRPRPLQDQGRRVSHVAPHPRQVQVCLS